MIAFAQSALPQKIERKIIIKNNNFYYTTIDEEFQIATLHIGKTTDSLNAAKHYALPAGRNYDEPVNPFSWDVCDSMFYAINLINHSQNDKRNSLRCFSLNSLHEWDSTITIRDMLMQSIEQNNFASNAPYSFIKKNVSNIMNNFFYDGIAINDSLYSMAITNNWELTFWNFNGQTWEHGEIKKFLLTGHFSLFSYNKKTYMLLNNGELYEATLDSFNLVKKRQGTLLNEGTIIINRDDNTIKFLNNNSINYKIPLNKLIQEKAVQIF